MNKVAATTDILQHESKDVGLLGLRLDGFQSVLMMRKIKRFLDGSEQVLYIVVTLILFQKRLPSRRILHEHLARKMKQMGIPWGLLKVIREPSLRTGKAECGS